jgi:Domain of unknown function (DUF4397)
MTFRRLWPLGLLALALASTGCNSGRTNPPDTVVRVLNATANYPQLFFKRGSRDPAPIQLDFLGGSSPTTWDEDTYNFHVTYGDVATRTEVEAHAFTKQIATGTWYTFVLYQKGGSVTHAVLEAPPVTSSATDAQVQAIHAVESVPTLDLYLVAPGGDVSAATPWGTVAFEGTLASRNVPGGDYELVATEQGNPAHVLYRSGAFTLQAGSATAFAIAPDAGEGIAAFHVAAVSAAGSTVLVDPSVQAAMRVINGADDQQPRDVALNNQFTPPLFPSTVFATPTPYLPIAPGTDVPLNVTPAGNPGVLELTGVVSPGSAAKYTLFFSGAAGALFMNLPQDNLRRVKSQAKVTFYDAAPRVPIVDVLILPPGTDPGTIPALDPFYGTDPNPSVTPGSIVPQTLWAGDFELTLRIALTTTVISGPTPITLKDAGLYGIVLSDNPDGTTIDMHFIDDFQ